MPLDPRIPMGYRPPEFANPLDMALKGGKLAALMQGQQANELLMQQKQQERDVMNKYRQGISALGPDATPENMLSVALKSGAVGPKDLASIVSTSENKKLALQQHVWGLKLQHDYRMSELETRLREGRITREEADARAADLRRDLETGRQTAARELHEMDATNKEGFIRLAASLRPAPAASIVYTDQGIFERGKGGLAQLTHPETGAPLTKAGSAAGEKASDAIVSAVKEGRMPLPSGFALRSPYWQDVINRVAQQDPGFDASRYVARSAARRTFASGPEARNVTSLNTVIGHLGTLDEAAAALENKDVRVVNAVVNRARQELGDPRITSFDTARQAVAEETMRVFRQVGASEQEAKDWRDRISSSGSPAQLRANISTLGQLLESRVEAIGQQYERTVNEQGNPARIDPKNRALLDKLKAPGWSPEKEQRYQELLRKRGGS